MTEYFKKGTTFSEKQTKQIAEATTFEAKGATVAALEKSLVHSTFITGDVFQPADIIYYCKIQPVFQKMKGPFPNVSRYMHTVYDHSQVYPAVEITLPPVGRVMEISTIFDISLVIPTPAPAAKANKSSGIKKDSGKEGKKGGKQEEGQQKGGKKEKEEKKKPAAAAPAGDPILYRLHVQVGIVKACEAHPTDENLLVEQIDVGESELRTVVSGVAGFMKPEEFVGKRVIVATNLKPGDLRGVVSKGRVFVATGADGKKEVLTPPEDAAIGERVICQGVTKEPDLPIVNNKHFSKMLKLFKVDGNVPKFDTFPLMTAVGKKSFITSDVVTGTWA